MSRRRRGARVLADLPALSTGPVTTMPGLFRPPLPATARALVDALRARIAETADAA